jgi:hypothetical protein
MSRTLYIFVTSERPDAYLNSVVHCLKYEEIVNITFVHIVGLESSTFRMQGNLEKGISFKVSQNAHVLLHNLAYDGEYTYFDNEEERKRVKLLEVYNEEQSKVDEIRRFYQECLDVKTWTHRDISYNGLRKEIARIKKQQPDSMFDVTAIGKQYLGDIIAICIIEGIDNLHTFSAKRKPDFDNPWRMLIHELRDGQKYEYINIINTDIFSDCSKSILVRTLPVTISIGIVGIIFLIISTISWLYGDDNLLLQIFGNIGIAAGILSVLLVFFPPRHQ